MRNGAWTTTSTGSLICACLFGGIACVGTESGCKSSTAAMIAGHSFCRTSAASDGRHRRLSTAVTGKERHAILQLGEEYGSGLAVEGVGRLPR